MNFIIREYISILKEDGELDALLADLLFEQGYNIKYKPEKGRQYGVDILAEKKEKALLKELRILTVKTGNITRKLWNGDVNAVKQSLEEILEVYIPNHLTHEEQKKPITITLATNGVISQNLDLDWTSFKNKHIKDNITIDFLGIDDISKQIDENFLLDTLLDSTNQSLFRKTLAFIDVSDYKFHHYNQLIDALLNKNITNKRELLKLLRLIKLLLNLIFKWCKEAGNLKSVLTISHITILKTYTYLQKNEKLKKKYVNDEFYKIYLTVRSIAVGYYNKVNSHYYVQHSIQRYSKNHIEYGLRSWEELGYLALLGNFELIEYITSYYTKNKEAQKLYIESLNNVSESIIAFINNNPSLKYPLYDDHLIEFNLAMHVLFMSQKYEMCLKWLQNITVALSNQYRLKKIFPLFRRDEEKLIDAYFGNYTVNVESSMLIASMLDWCIILDSEEHYSKVIEFVKILDNKISIQTWYPTEETVKICLNDLYSRNSGNIFEFKKIPTYTEYKDNLKSLREKFVKANQFEPLATGLETLHHIASVHYKQLPLPYLHHRFALVNKEQ